MSWKLTAAVATTATLIALALALLPPTDLLAQLRSATYTAHYPWGLVAADGSHAYAEVGPYRVALNLWKIVICDGGCTSQDINAIQLYAQLKAQGQLVIEDKGGGCYHAQLKPTQLAARTIAADVTFCLQRGVPTRIDGTVTIDGHEIRLGGEPRVEPTFPMDKYLEVHEKT